MNSIVISFIIILISVLILIEFSFISLVSSLLLVFSLNLFIVLKITLNCKQNDENVDNFESKTHNNNNNNNYYFYVIYYKRKVLFHLKRVCFGFIYDKLSKHLTKVEKTLTEKPFCDNCLEIKNELNVISHLITDNYVEFWYQSIGTDNKDFENDCQQILQKMFLNLFERCEQRIDKQMFCQKLIILLENHLNDTKSVQNLSEINEIKRIDSIIARVIRLTATEDITRVISNRNSGQRHRDLSLVLMIKEMLSHSVFLPIVDIITDQKFIYENLFYLITNSELKLNHKNKIEYQLQNTNPINELNHEFKDQIQTIDSIDNTRRKLSEESNGKQLMKQISNDSEEDNFRSFDLNEFSDYESNDDLIAEALEAEEEEENKEKLISNLVITKTEEINYNSYFIMYFIEYDGIFQQIINCQKSGTNFNQKIGLIRKPVLVKRRFSEFIALQKVLERDKTFKRLMRGLKKPTSIQITAQNLLSFAGSANTRLDSSTVEFRRIYLQNFLKQLSNLKAISESPQFKQFLAYGTDSSIAFVNSNSDNLPLNIDKVLFRGFKGVISVMKSALPIEAQIGKIDPKFGERTIPETEKLTIKSIATNVESNNSMQLEKKLNIWSETDLNDSFGVKEDISSDKESDCLGARTLGDGCEDPIAYELKPISNKRETYHWNSSPTSHAISCFIVFITNNIKLIEKIIYRKLIIYVFGTIIERFIEELVSKLITSEMSVRHIHSLHSALWPTNETEVQNESKVQNDNCLDQTVSALYLHMKSTLDSINPYISYVSNHLNLRLFLENFLNKLNDSNKNKLFLYKFCELILDDIE